MVAQDTVHIGDTVTINGRDGEWTVDLRERDKTWDFHFWLCSNEEGHTTRVTDDDIVSIVEKTPSLGCFNLQRDGHRTISVETEKGSYIVATLNDFVNGYVLRNIVDRISKSSTTDALVKQIIED